MAGYVLLRLPLEIKDLFREWLNAHAPLKAVHVMSAVKAAGGGQIYDSTYGVRQRGTGVYADLLLQRFEKACRRLGLNVVIVMDAVGLIGAEKFCLILK